MSYLKFGNFTNVHVCFNCYFISVPYLRRLAAVTEVVVQYLWSRSLSFQQSQCFALQLPPFQEQPENMESSIKFELNLFLFLEMSELNYIMIITKVSTWNSYKHRFTHLHTQTKVPLLHYTILIIFISYANLDRFN